MPGVRLQRISFGICRCVTTRQLAVQPASSHTGAVTDLNLLQKNAIGNTVNTKGFFSSMFTVPKKDGGWRSIINLKSLNFHLVVSRFKMESIGSLKVVLQEGNFKGKDRPSLSVPVHLGDKYTGSDSYHLSWLQHQKSSQKYS